MQILPSDFGGCAVHCDQTRAQFPTSCKSGGCGEGPNCMIRPLRGRVLSQTRKGKGLTVQEPVQVQPSRQLRLGRPFPPAPNLLQKVGTRLPRQGPVRGCIARLGPYHCRARCLARGSDAVSEPGPAPSGVRGRRRGRLQSRKARAWALAVVCGSWRPLFLLTSVFLLLNGAELRPH